jgi:hypothetical protein
MSIWKPVLSLFHTVKHPHSAGFEALTTVTMKSGVFWVVTPCNWETCRYFGEIYSLGLRVWRVRIAACFLVDLLFGPEDEGDIFLRNVGLYPNYKELNQEDTSSHELYGLWSFRVMLGIERTKLFEKNFTFCMLQAEQNIFPHLSINTILKRIHLNPLYIISLILFFYFSLFYKFRDASHIFGHSYFFMTWLSTIILTHLRPNSR